MDLVGFSDEAEELITEDIVIETGFLGVAVKEDVCPLGVRRLIDFQVLFEVAVLAEFLIEFWLGFFKWRRNTSPQ